MKTFAVVGSPNSGKTTLYNWLTNSKFKTVNYPGATVEYSIGDLAPHLGDGLVVIDTPGIYSLQPKSLDEEVTLKAIYNNPEMGQVDGIVLVLDGTQLERQFLLVKQFIMTGFPLIITVTMADLLRSEGLDLNVSRISNEFNTPVILFDGLLGGGLKELVSEMNKAHVHQNVLKPTSLSLAEKEKWLIESQTLAEKVFNNTNQVEAKKKALVSQTQKFDQIFLHPLIGPVLFFGIMSGLFTSIFWLAKPFMDFVGDVFSKVNQVIITMGGQNLLTDFLANGVVSSFSSVLVFVPQIFILFLGIGFLEGTGYLARAATLIDRPFSFLGMSGRSFVPLLSGFSCAVPAMIATRNISSQRDRLITNLVIPLMTCSARLPVYALLLSFVFIDEPSWKAGVALAAVYIFSLLIGAIAAFILNKIIKKDRSSLLLMELPLYRSPRIKVILQQAMSRTFSYVKKAGPIIFIIAVIMWGGTHFPNYQSENSAKQLEQSYAGQAGKMLEPIVAPMGIDWRVGVGLISAFAAREVFVSTLAVVFNVGDENEENLQTSLLKQMKVAENSRGQKIFTTSTVIGIIVFFMIALQCMSTFAVSVRENGAIKIAIAQLVILNLLAYGVTVLVVQGLRSMGVA